MAAEKAWLKAFSSGSKALQDRLRKVHAKNPEFQSFLGKHGFEGGSSVKQASKAQTVSKEVAAKRAELSDKAYGATTGAKVGGEHGSSDEYKDTTVPLTKDQHSKVQAAKKAALTKDERLAAIARATRKSKTGERYEIPTEDPDDAGHEDLRDVHHSLHIGHGSSLDEQVEQLDEAAKRAINITPEDLEVIKSGDHETVKKHMAKLISRAADTKLNKRPLRSDKASEFLNKIHASTNVGQLQKMAYNMYLGGDDAGKSKYGSLHVYNPQSKMGRSYQSRYGISEASMKGMPFTDAEKARLAKYDQADKQKINKRVTTRKYEGDDAYSHAVFVDGKPVITGLHKSQVKHYMKQASDKLNEEVGLDEATKAYKDPITGQVTQIPAHKAPTYGFNKFGQFASLDRVPKPRKKLHNTAHHLMRTVDEFEEGSPERQAVTDALKKVVGAIKEEKVEEAHIDPNFVATFGVAAAAYDHVLNPLLKKAKQKIADKMAEKLGKKKEAPAEQVAEASLAADIQRDVDARNKRLADAAAKAKKKKAADIKAAVAAKKAKEMDKLKNLSKYGSDEEKEYAKGELQRIKNLEEANFKYDVDHMPGQTVRGTLPTSCPTCYGRKAMYKTPEGKMYADKKTEDSKRVACPDCQGKGYVAEESNEDSNYLNNKKTQIRESILGKLAAKTGKNQ